MKTTNMRKAHVVLKKEDISQEKMRVGDKTVVVLDVLLATTTITSALADGATEVIPVMDVTEGMNVASGMDPDTCVLAGEIHARPIDGFVYPSPSHIRSVIKNKKLVLSTTNGTVALRKSEGALRVYIGCLLNNPAVAKTIRDESLAETILIVCSGNSGDLSLEDFYGAGHFLDCLVQKDEWELTDSAKAALQFYRGAQGSVYELLSESRVGQLFCENGFLEELKFAAGVGTTSIVPVLKNGIVVIHQPVSMNKGSDLFYGKSEHSQ
ncbi:2-phosphosulfolactate phosphatase family protein [Aeromicrobium ponti]|uniref:Probable 2-phosphosulfolactate phosphatase n=1 Tax=Cytobacillus oceanisediminis TaxID=665099 RepID=A0A562K5G3_9BACI|nr:2-phosphosulfolactate phosphatase [Cytobacillus oceanisediminis]TWH90637.1 2-phosphosulfolactate phosphatase [Cytobacillus oceanisediminis]